VRNEWFRDEEGERTGFATNYSSHTVGFTYQLSPSIMVRPEVGYYHAKAFDLGKKDYTVIGGLDVTLRFSKAQLRPVLLVIVVATLGMIPAMVAHGIGSDIQRPLATVMVGGLLSTLFLTPLALPAVYVLAERLRRSPGDCERTTRE
jgi:hypothetical protein